MAPLRVLCHLPASMLRHFAGSLEDVEFVDIPATGELDTGVSGEVLLTRQVGVENLAAALARGVRWVHMFGTGVDGFPFETLGDRTLTCSRGASAVPIAEWVLAMMLAAEKQLPGSWLDRPPEAWNSARLGGLQGRTLGLVGIGAIAQAIAARALPFGMQILASRRSNAPIPIEGVERAESLNALAAASDHLVIAAPATPRTRHLIDGDVLAHVKPGAHLINIARGSLLDQDALRDALDDDRLSLASLDVCEPEPLPAGHWLYSHERVRLSPHISWSMPGSLEALVRPFLTNLERFAAGQPLEYVVDAAERY